jgi:fumarate reductase (CoM/CoB) subunit A
MEKYDPRGELATRDVVARAIYQEIIEGRGTPRGGVYLDVTHLSRKIIEDKLETMLLQFLDVDLDIREEPMEVAPTAHHFMGGTRINEHGETSTKNLFAAGEVTGGVHGANRLGGNALADTQVFGKRAGESAAKNALNTKSTFNMEQAIAEQDRIQILFKDGDYYPFEIKKELEEVMWKYVAIIRNKKGLETALERINELKVMLSNLKVPDLGEFNKDLQDALEIENMLNIADLVATSALIREESRGAHYRSDYPKTRDEWKKSIELNKDTDVRFIQR